MQFIHKNGIKLIRTKVLKLNLNLAQELKMNGIKIKGNLVPRNVMSNFIGLTGVCDGCNSQ